MMHVLSARAKRGNQNKIDNKSSERSALDEECVHIFIATIIELKLR